MANRGWSPSAPESEIPRNAEHERLRTDRGFYGDRNAGRPPMTRDEIRETLEKEKLPKNN